MDTSIKLSLITSLLLITVFSVCSCAKDNPPDLKEAARSMIAELPFSDDICFTSDGSVDFENGFSYSTTVAEKIRNDWSTPQGIDAIKSLIADQDTYTPQMAVITLGYLGSKPEVFEALVDQLGITDPSMSEAASMAFGFMPYAPESMHIEEINHELMKAWSNDNLLLNMNIAYVVNYGEDNPDNLDVLKSDISRAFESEDSDVRYCAARAVLHNNLLLNEFILYIVTLLNDNDPRLQRIALQALNMAQYFTSDTVDLAIPLMQDENIDVRLESATYVGNADPVLNIGNETRNQALNVLVDMLHNDNVCYALVAIRRIGIFGEYASDSVPVLMEVIENPDIDSKMRATAIYAFGNIRPEPSVAVPLLIELLHSQDNDIQIAAVDALGRMGPDAKEAVPDLIELLDNPDPSLVSYVIITLGTIGPGAEPAIPELARLLDGPDKFTAVAAAFALCQIDPGSEIAISTLRNMLNDEDPTIASMAQEILSQLSY